MIGIFSQTTVRVCSDYLNQITSKNQSVEAVFSKLATEINISSQFKESTASWTLEGDWDSVNQAFKWLSIILNDGDIEEATGLCVEDLQYSTEISRNGKRRRATEPPSQEEAVAESDDDAFNVPTVELSYSELDPDLAHASNYKETIYRVISDISENDSSRRKSKSKRRGKCLRGTADRIPTRSSAEHKKMKRELMIDKPLFSVDEIIKNIERRASPTIHRVPEDEGEKLDEQGEEDDTSGEKMTLNRTTNPRQHSTLKFTNYTDGNLKPKSKSRRKKPKHKPAKHSSQHIEPTEKGDNEHGNLSDTSSPEPLDFSIGGKSPDDLFPDITCDNTPSEGSKDSQICPVCSKHLSSTSNLYRHMKIAHQGVRHDCEQCDKRFTCKDSLQRHVRIVHDGLRCAYCFVIFNTPEMMDAHQCPGRKEADGATCPQCGKSYSCTSNLNKHIKVAHDGLSFHCDLCDKDYRSKESLNEHQRTVHRMFCCQMPACAAVFENEEEYADHVIVTHGDVKDEEDKRKQLKEKLVTKVIRKRSPASCDVCGKTFSSVSNLGKHMKVVHEKVRHHCDKCERAFTCKEQLKRHQRVVHEGQTFPCCFCSEEFANRHSLAKHQNIVHKQLSTESSFQCEICGKAFLYDCNLTRHRKRDHEGLRFKCSLCDREFKSKQRLQEHARVEHEGHRCLCEQCPKMFRNKHKLKEHVISVHTTLKPHRCFSCNSSFARRSALTYHLHKVHNHPETEPIPPEPLKTTPDKAVDDNVEETAPAADGQAIFSTEEASGASIIENHCVNPPVLYSESLLHPQIQVPGLLPANVMISLPQTVPALPQPIISHHLTNQPMGVTDITQPTITAMAPFDPNSAVGLIPQQQVDQQQQVFLSQQLLHHMPPVSMGSVEASQQVHIPNLISHPTLQTSFLTQNNVTTTSLTSLDISGLSQIGQTQFILPADGTANFYSGQQQLQQGSISTGQALNSDNMLHKGANNQHAT